MEADEVTLELPTATGVAQIKLRLPAGPMGLAGLVPFAQVVTNTLVEKAVEREEAEGRSISCKAGCGACCRQLVPLSIPEAFALADVVLDMEEARRDQIFAKFDELESAVKKHGLWRALQDVVEGKAVNDKDLGFQYLAKGLACPFLEQESCSIHPDRPTACRDFLVTTPAAHCATLGLLPLRKVPTPVLLSEVLSRVTARLLGRAPIVVPMTLVMNWVDAHAELGVRTWPALEVLTVLLEELGVSVPWKNRDEASSRT